MVIKKISFDDVNYIVVKAELDLEKRILTLNLNDNKFKQVFNCYYEELSDNTGEISSEVESGPIRLTKRPMRQKQIRPRLK